MAWHFYCKTLGMNRSTRQIVKKSSVHLLQTRILALYAVVLLVAGYVQADSRGPDTAEPNASNATSLRIALNRWSSTLTAAGDGSSTAYDFALADKRLAIPDCSDFVIDPMNRIPSNTAPASLVVDVQCRDKNWQRRIRGRRDADNTAQGESAKPTVQIFSLTRPVKKGEKLTSDVFAIERALIHRTPQNAVSRLHGKQYYAARHLLPGRTLVESDLVVGQRVVVLTQAIPARSPIARENIAIQERAVDVPHDAIRSLEGLTMLAANRLLHPGDILRKRDLTKAKLIKRGQTVAVESLGKHFRIASELVALQDGYLGDQIALRNPSSSRRVTAVVTGIGTARSAKRL